jgi:hypothetical protein
MRHILILTLLCSLGYAQEVITITHKPATAGGTIAYVTSSATVNFGCGGSSTSCSISSAPVVSGQMMIVVIDLDDTGTISSITSPHCTSWAVVDTGLRTGVFKKVAYWCLANGTGTDTITINFGQANAFPDSSYMAFTGVTTLDQHANANGNNTSCSIGPTSATAAANELVFASCSDDTSITWANGTTGYSQIAAASSGFLSNQWKAVSATGTQSFADTVTGGHPWVGIVGTFQ